MPSVYRLAMPALCLSLILPCAFSVEAADPAPASTAEPKGAVIIVPGAGETADWPQVIGPLRSKLPDVEWSSLSITLPDLQSDVIAPRVIAPAAAPKAPESGSKDSTTAQPIEQAAGGEAEVADQVVAETTEEQSKADAERIFARIDAAIAYAEQQSARRVVVLGHGTGAYWAARFLSERQSSQVEKLVMVDAQTPSKAKPQLAELTPTLKLPAADIFYMDKALDRNAALERMQASKRLKTSTFSQVALKALPDKKAEQEQLFRRVRGWLNPQKTD